MILLFLILSFLFQDFPFPVQEEYLVQKFTVEDGLPVNSVSQVLQDDAGYLWFATLDGLVRYDGYEFKTYNSINTKGIYTNRIAGMLQTASDEIWLINEDGTVTRKKGSTFITYGELQGDFTGTASRILQDDEDTLWLTTSKGVLQFNLESEQFEYPDSPHLKQDTWAIGKASGGGMLFAGESGLILFQNNSATQLLKWKDFPVSQETVTQLKSINGDEVWAVSSNGAFRYSIKENRVTFVFTFNEERGNVWNVHPLPDSTLLFNTSHGFYRFDPEDEQIEKEPLEFNSPTPRPHLLFTGPDDESVRIGDDELEINGRTVLKANGFQAAFIDREGSLWVSSIFDGLYQIRRSNISNLSEQQVSGFYNVYPVVETRDGSVWAGNLHNGIYRFSGDDITNWTPQNSNLPGYFCRFLFEDTDGTLYAGMWTNNLWKFENGDWIAVEGLHSLIGSNATIEAMHRDKVGRLWIGTDGPLVVHHNNSYRLYDDSGDTAFRGVRVIRESDSGSVFLGTNGNGLTIINDGESTHYTNQNSSLTSNLIRDIYVQSADTLWLATENLGLNRLILNNGGRSIKSSASVTTEDGLIHNSLHRIIKTKGGRLWISSNGGIMNISLSQLNHYASGILTDIYIIGFNERNGMLNREANGGVQTAGVLTSDQKLLFPNQTGITVIDPGRIAAQSSLPPPRPIIEKVTFADSTLFVEKQQTILIPTGERNLRINFSAPNFTTPDHIQFRYKMEGVNPNWENANESREAVLTNIPPGTHQFQLRAYRTGEAAQTAEATFFITIPPVYYETWWFRLIAVTGVLLLVYCGDRYRTRVLINREKKLQERVDQQTVQLKKAAEQKSRFFSGITHELKTPLSLITSPLDDLLESTVTLSDGKVRQRLLLMKRNSNHLQNLVDQILEVTKLNSDAIKLTLQPVNITKLTRQVVGQFHSKFEQQEITLAFESEPVTGNIYIDTGAWERIVINLVSNAIRFSPRGSSIHVNIRDAGDQVSIAVKDEGIGIDEKEAEKVFEYLYQAKNDYAAGGTGIGLYLVKGLVEHMGGRIGLVSKRGKGAEFIITLPKEYAHARDTDTVLHIPVANLPSEVSDGSKAEDLTTENARSEENTHILMVEDNDDFREYLQSVLSEKYCVTAASEGSEALKVLKQDRIDLVISDIMMPGMDGLEFVNNLRKESKYQHLPVIFLSAKNQDTDKEVGLSTGADIYLTKPIKSRLLMSQIAAVLRRENVLKNNQLYDEKGDEDEMVKEVRKIIYRQLANPALNVEMLAEFLFMSRSKLYADWKEVCDIPLSAFIKKTRLEEAKILLEQQGFSVQETAFAVGFNDPNYFSVSFKKEFGISPSEV